MEFTTPSEPTRSCAATVTSVAAQVFRIERTWQEKGKQHRQVRYANERQVGKR